MTGLPPPGSFIVTLIGPVLRAAVLAVAQRGLLLAACVGLGWRLSVWLGVCR